MEMKSNTTGTRNNRLLLACLLISGILLFLAALAETIVAGLTQHRLRSNISFFTLPGSYERVPHVKALTKSAPGEEVAAGALGLVQALASLGGAVYCLSRKSRGQQKRVVIAVLLAGIALSVVQMGLLAAVFDAMASSAKLQWQNNGYLNGWSDDITWEGWVSQIYPHADFESDRGWFKKSCTLNRASRWTMVPLLILSLFTTAMAGINCF